MSERQTIYRLLYEALLEIRDAGRQAGDARVFHLADLIHNIPLQLERVAEGEETYAQVLKTMQDRAKETGGDKWMKQILTHLDMKAAV